MNEENQVYFIDSDQLPPAALERKHKLEQDPSFRTDYMKYLDDMEIIDSDIKNKVLKAMDEYDYDSVFLLYGLYRALGKPGMSVVLTVISLGTRVALAYLLSSLPSIGVTGIWWSVPIGWALADFVGFVYYKKKIKLYDGSQP